MSSQLILQTIANAIASSGMLALIAVGLTLAFGVMQMANLAHGHFLMIGAKIINYICICEYKMLVLHNCCKYYQNIKSNKYIGGTLIE